MRSGLIEPWLASSAWVSLFSKGVLSLVISRFYSLVFVEVVLNFRIFISYKDDVLARRKIRSDRTLP